jgi:hypothetical protein
MKNECDQRKLSQSETLAKWLGMSSQNHLVIFAGKTTIDEKHRVNNYAHAGIQNRLFPNIRGKKEITDQVVVCSYNGLEHNDAYKEFDDWVNKPKIESPDQCPSSRIVGKAQGWRP